MTEKKKLVLSSKLTAEAILRKMKEKQISFGTNNENTVTFDFKKRQRRGAERRDFVEEPVTMARKSEDLTDAELRMRLAALKGLAADESMTEPEDGVVVEAVPDSLPENIMSEGSIDGPEKTEIDEEVIADTVELGTASIEEEASDPVPETVPEKVIIEELTIPTQTPKPEVKDDRPVMKSLDDLVREEIAKNTTPGLRKPIQAVQQQNRPGTSDTSPDSKKSGLKSKIDKGTEKRQNRLSMSTTLEERAERIRAMSARRANSHAFDRGRSSHLGSLSREVSVPEFITVQELANRAAIKGAQIVKVLFSMGMPVTINQTIDVDTAEIVLNELGHTCRREQDLTLEDYVAEMSVGSEVKTEQRPPIVTVMGHVDHGKTSLLDTIRKTDIISTESGGITQHIGAYQITLPSGRRITFIDTPGHEAFTEMRSRGANTTDIVVLVVAADDGVKRQTVEAISHAKAAKVPMIVAINKIDKNDADPDRVRQDLLNYEVVVEKFGGDVTDVEISAKKAINIDKLEEVILLETDMMELKANTVGYASGVIIEAEQKKGLGVVATVLIKNGQLKKGDVFVSGTIFGKVRSIMDDKGKQVASAGPSCPVEVIGFEGVPVPGDDFCVLDSESKAKEIANIRDRKKRESINAKRNKTSMERMFERLDDEKMKKLTVIVKADVQGSVEAIVSSLQKLSNDEVEVDVVFSAIGEITENDIILAKASDAVVFGFNVRANSKARDKAKVSDISILYHSIVYDLIEDVKGMLSGFLAPTITEEITGHAEVRQVFFISKTGNIAGCMVKDGLVKRGSRARLLRDNTVIYDTSIKSLKMGKNDAKEAKEGFECGILLDGYQDIKDKDVIETYEIKETERTLD